jgi:hypothetical protein
MKRTAVVLAMLMLAARAHAISLGQIDDFQDGTTQNWTDGSPSPNPPVNISDGGPAGVGDAFLQDVSAGGDGAGGALVMFNFTQWIGDYVAAGVDAIEADMANLGADPLHMRIAFQGAAGTQYGSTDAAVLPADGEWYHLRFDLTAVTLIEGEDSLDVVLANLTTLRILSSEAGPAWKGDRIAATLGVDNITAVAAVPLPAAAWMLLAALGATAGLRRRG